jgi:RNA recognition motif-containing protein
LACFSGNSVYVGNLPWSVTDDDLYALMEPAGEVVKANIKFGRDGRSRGCGVVEYTTAAGALEGKDTPELYRTRP